MEVRLRTAEETAVLLAYMMKLSGQTRVRFSEKTLKRVGGRSYLRATFVGMVGQHLDDLGLNMTQLQRGGFGLIKASVLEGAPLVTSKEYLKTLIKELKSDKAHQKLQAIRREVEADQGTDDDDE